MVLSGAGMNLIATTCQFTSNPGSSFQAGGRFFDLHLSNLSGVTSVTLAVCPITGKSQIFFFANGTWQGASNVVVQGNCLVVTITTSTSPTLAQLSGLPFGVVLPPAAIGSEGESTITTLQFRNLFMRFRQPQITAGTRDAILIAVALCDGGVEASDQVTFLSPVAAASPTISGGLASLPCIQTGGTDGLNTAINGAMLRFKGPGAKALRLVRLWADLCLRSGSINGVLNCQQGGYSSQGGGALFGPGEGIQQVTPRYNPGTDEVIATFGHRQEQIFSTGAGVPLMALDPFNVPIVGNNNPGILVFTADIGHDASPGPVEVELTLYTGDVHGPRGQWHLRARGGRFLLSCRGASNQLRLAASQTPTGAGRVYHQPAHRRAERSVCCAAACKE